MNKRTRSSLDRQLGAFLDRLFYCPSCTTWRLPQPLRAARVADRTSKRHASTLTSSTAINATKPIPQRLKPLYEALLDVRKSASTHVNTSRLQLALQGLESSNPTIRLAILGLNIPDTARRIARLLQADELEDEQPWEEQLAEGKDDYSRGMIIRYGDPGSSNVPRPRNAVPVLYVPARVLERNNIEILISSLNGSEEVSQTTSIPSDNFLSPVITVPTSFDGRQTIVSQPVHKCLLVARGFDELLAASRLLAATKFMSEEDRESVSVVVDISNFNVSGSEGQVLAVDVSKAEEGLSAIRDSVTRATEYEHKWINAGMLGLSSWLKFETAEEATITDSLQQPVRTLVSSVLKAAESNIEATSLSLLSSHTEQSLSLSTSTNLEAAIEEFSRSAHQELQQGLSSAWSSRNWRKLAWYKLFWRVDDVNLIVTDLVTNAWLPRTERAVYELSGRLSQVGISPIFDQETPILTPEITAITPSPVTETETPPVLESTTQQLATASSATAGLATPSSTTLEPVITTTPLDKAAIQFQPIPQPLPLTSTIPLSRTTHLTNAVTTLTTTAQQLLLRTLSITGLTSGLSALTYFSSLTSSVYEAGTIAAIGTVFALYRMQGGWLKATRNLENGLFEEGRNVIVDVVGGMRRAIQRKVQADVDRGVLEGQGLDKSRDAVSRARTELDKIGGGK